MTTLLLIAFAGPPVEATLIDDRKISGVLAAVDDANIVVELNGERNALPRTDLLRLDFKSATPSKPTMTIRLVDGSRFGARTFESDGRTATVTSDYGRLNFPVEKLAALLFVDDPHEAAEFAARSTEKTTTDRLALARDGKRLVLEGVVGKIGAEKIAFTLDGDELPINRSRVKAIYFAQKASAAKPVAMIGDRTGNVFASTEWRWKDGVALKSPAGFELTIPVGSLAEIDLSAGRVVYLSDLEPTLMQHTPGFDHPWPILRDRGPDGGKLELGGTRHAKGMLLHSKTVVYFALNAEYRRFKTVVGIPTAAGPSGDAEARVLVDGKEVWSHRIRAGENPLHLDLSIAQAKSIRLEVDFGRNLDLGDHVAFAGARVVK